MTNDQQPSTPPPGTDFETSKAMLRLLVGLALEGTDELSRRLRAWEAEVVQKKVTPPPTDPGSHTMSDADRLFYALIGMTFAIRQRAARDMAGWLLSPGRVIQQMSDNVDKLSQNPLLRPFIKPVKDQADALGQQMQDEVERWIALGQAEERHSRAVARVAVPELIDEVLEILAENPELRALIQQQSVGLAGEVVDSMREVTVTADAVVEGIVRKMLRRAPRKQLPVRDTHLLPEPDPNGRKES